MRALSTPELDKHLPASSVSHTCTVTMSQDPKLTSRIAILGAGDVGATIAYSLIMNPVAGDILMVDPKEEVRDAQVQDLSDATFHGNTTTRVRAGTHKEAGQCDIVVITAGAKQKQGKSNLPTCMHKT
jgi:L-lactate dehydrogenase